MRLCGGSWWFVVVRGGSWWFSVVGSWWFVVVFFQKSPEKGHVTLCSTNQRTKFTMKSHFWWDFLFAPFHLKSIPLKSSAKNATASGALRQTLSTGQYLLTLHYNYTLLCWQNFSELPNPRSTSGETIQNSLNYWNRKQGLLIWSVVERINFLFKWNSRSMHIYIQNCLEITL